MNDQRMHPCGYGCCGFAAIEQIPRIHPVSGGAGAAIYFCQNGRKIFILCGGIQNAEGFASEFGGFGAVFCFGVIARGSPGLWNVQDFSLLCESNPQVVVE